MKPFFRCLMLLAALLSLTSCKSTGPEVMPPSVKDDAYVFFQRNDVELFWVPSSGSFADSTFNAVSTTAPSQMAMRLSKIMARGGVRPVDIAISGPNGAKVRRIIKDAFNEQITRLPKLHLLYIGEPVELEELEKMAKDLNVRFFYLAKPAAELGGKPSKPSK
jgi:predicted small lipoprotein YifL